jgi:hypothetical protein
MWDLRSGAPLASWHLHGPVVELVMHGSELAASTELGDAMRVDLAAFTRDRCELLREVWRSVPVVWEDGAPVAAESPTRHECVQNGR